MTRILYVDDDPAVAKIVLRGLLRKGYETEIVGDGAGALSLLSGAERFGLVAVDYQLPDMSGLELVARVKELAPDVPVLLVSGHRGQVDLAEAARAGVDEYLPKPFTLAALSETVARLVAPQAS